MGTSNASKVAEMLAKQRTKNAQAKTAQSRSTESKLSALNEEKNDSSSNTYPSEEKYSADDSVAPLLGRGDRISQTMKPTSAGGTRSANRQNRYDESDDEEAGLLSKSADF